MIHITALYALTWIYFHDIKKTTRQNEVLEIQTTHLYILILIFSSNWWILVENRFLLCASVQCCGTVSLSTSVSLQWVEVTMILLPSSSTVLQCKLFTLYWLDRLPVKTRMCGCGWSVSTLYCTKEIEKSEFSQLNRVYAQRLFTWRISSKEEECLRTVELKSLWLH